MQTPSQTIQSVTREDASHQFSFFLKELVWLRAIWKNSEMLSSPSLPDRQKFSDIADTFFAVTQQALFIDTILTLRRLADGTQSLGHSCLPLEGVIQTFDKVRSDDFAVPFDSSAAKKLLEQFRGYVSDAKELKDEILSHNSFAVALGTKAVKGIQGEKITKAISALSKCAEIFHESIFNRPIDWDEEDLVGHFDDFYNAITPLP